jgi:16S rRNA (adenine1518-N6/adenine1519-N6)-dimethyltransferase
MSEPYAKKSLGQHWLHDTASLQAMCDAADVQAGDNVLEVGPGTGTLTTQLLNRRANIVAVELDESLADDLERRFSGKPFVLHRQSILEFDLTTLGLDYKLVANIPYYLTSNLIRTISESTNPPVIAVLLVQKEVAERVASRPGDMSLLSVTAQYYWEVSRGPLVPAKLFTPPPKVDSQILILHRRPTPLFDQDISKEYFQLVKAGFSNRRKTLLNSLSGGLHLAKPETLALLDTAGITHTKRPQELTLEQWHALYLQVQQSNNIK